MKRRKIILIATIVFFLILLLIVNPLVFWGFCFDQDGGFESTSQSFLEQLFSGREDSYIRIEDGTRSIGLPFFLIFCPLNAPSYHIDIFIEDEHHSMHKIAIETITIDYDDGEHSQKRVNYLKDFHASYYSRKQNEGKLSIPNMTLDAKLYFAVSKSKSCTVKLNGYFIDSDEKKIPFESTNYFEYEPTSWRVYPGRGSF